MVKKIREELLLLEKSRDFSPNDTIVRKSKISILEKLLNEVDNLDKDLVTAMEGGIDIDYQYDGNDRVPYDVFRLDIALDNVKKVLVHYGKL